MCRAVVGVVLPTAELPPPYTAIASPDAGGVPVINCRVCQSLINLDGKLHQHVVKCTVCNEATVRPPPLHLPNTPGHSHILSGKSLVSFVNRRSLLTVKLFTGRCSYTGSCKALLPVSVHYLCFLYPFLLSVAHQTAPVADLRVPYDGFSHSSPLHPAGTVHSAGSCLWCG